MGKTAFGEHVAHRLSQSADGVRCTTLAIQLGVYSSSRKGHCICMFYNMTRRPRRRAREYIVLDNSVMVSNAIGGKLFKIYKASYDCPCWAH